MESKLPKPSMLKRPTPVTRTILPTDRIRAASQLANAFGNRTFASASNLSKCVPERRDRAASPDLQRPVRSPTRAKLRRSRSACDVRDMVPMKRPMATLAPIPTKTSRTILGAVNTTVTTTSVPAKKMFAPLKTVPATEPATQASSNASRPGRTGAVTKTITKRPVPSAGGAMKGASQRIGAGNGSKKSSEGSSSGGGGGVKAANVKRIPPYDYKARFNDLMEKHKALKEKYDDKVDQMTHLDGLPEQFEESQSQLFRAQDQLKHAESNIECLNRQVKAQTTQYETLSQNFSQAKEELEKTTRAFELMKSEHEALSIEVAELRERTEKLTAENSQLLDEVNACKDQLFHSNIERKELHNTILDLRGNIRVFCRVRPPLESEEDKLLCGWNYLDEATVEISNPDMVAKNKQGSHLFNFDYVFHPNSLQEDIFEMVSPLIQSALDGYNVCIFAYGQTGSGKTFTMDGIPSKPGVIPRTVDLLFDSVQNYKRLGWEYEIKVTFLEIYNEVLYDLLSNEQKDMEIRMAKNNKNDIYVSNITQETVTSAARLRHLMQVAKMNRATAATVGNERSSRSHAVTKIELIGTHAEKQETSIGSINLVDLAGSESPKTSTRMNETKNINRSLSELTNVILALLQKQDHIPYRNSKLTHLLMPALGGNSKTLMFINVAPFMDCFGESVKSLRFAASVNSCKLAKAKRNRFLNSSAASFEK